MALARTASLLLCLALGGEANLSYCDKFHGMSGCTKVGTATQLLEGAMLAVTDYCADETSRDKADLLGHAFALNAILHKYGKGELNGDSEFLAALPAAADDAYAALLLGCSTQPVNHGPLLVSNARALLLHVDGDANRVFSVGDKRLDLFNDYKVFHNDNGVKDDATLDAIYDLYVGFPSDLLPEMFVNAPFVSTHCRACFPGYDSDFGHDKRAPLYTTDRGFNYNEQGLGYRTEDVFWGDHVKNSAEWPGTPAADGSMSLYRHEFAHQIDRTMDDRQEKLFQSIRGRCTKDADWLRGHGQWLKPRPQEIIAGQVGNQYLYSTSTQFDVARTGFDSGESKLQMEWFLFNVDIIGDETSSTFFERSQLGYVDSITVGIVRCHGTIQQLNIPGCGVFDFTYDATGALEDYTPRLDGPNHCIPSLDGLTQAPTGAVECATFEPTPQPTRAPTSTLARGFPDCGVVVLKGGYQSHKDRDDMRKCVADPYEKYAFACCDDSNACSRFTGEEDTAESCYAGKQPSVPQTYFEAKDTCAMHGLKLCDYANPGAQYPKTSPHCRAGKCWYDNQFTWSNIPCDAPNVESLYGIEGCPTMFPTPTPTAKPTPCDDPSWTKASGEDWKNCAWVAEKPQNRCDKRGTLVPDGAIVRAYDACPCACEGWCADEPWEGDLGKTCDWVAERNTEKRCKYMGTSEPDDAPWTVAAHEKCCACDAYEFPTEPPSTCVDQPWSRLDKNCAWVAAWNSDDRCARLGSSTPDGDMVVPASEACCVCGNL